MYRITVYKIVRKKLMAKALSQEVNPSISHDER